MSAELKLDDKVDAAAPPRPRGAIYPWLLILFLMVLYTCSYIDRTILSLLVKPIRADFAVSDTWFSLLLTGFVFFYTFVGIPLGRIVDRWNRRWLIAIGVGLWSLMTAASGLASTYGRLFAARIGVGVGEASLSPASYSLAADYFPPEKLGRALAIYAMGAPIGSGLALLIGGSVVKAIEDFGPLDLPLIGAMRPWQTVFMVVGLPGLILAVLSLFLIREPRRQKTPSGAPAEPKPSFGAVLAHMWQNRSVYMAILLGIGVGTMPAYGANQWLPAFLQRVYGFSIADSGLFLGASTLVLGVSGSLCGGWLADRLVARGCMDGHLLVGMVYCAGVVVCIGLGPILPVGWLGLTLISLNGFFANTWIGVNAAALQIVTPSRMRGQVSALYLFVAALIAIAGGPFAVAVGTDHIFGRDDAVGLSLSLNAAVFATLGIVFLHFGRKPLQRLRQAQRERA